MLNVGRALECRGICAVSAVAAGSFHTFNSRTAAQKTVGVHDCLSVRERQRFPKQENAQVMDLFAASMSTFVTSLRAEVFNLHTNPWPTWGHCG